ncbi:MAG TPA: hypothetical protein VFU07_06635 [Candidatus Lumbricidophila sp.]|nr:hypothetical protein [Candidatus Lumbricidophila sp.]
MADPTPDVPTVAAPPRKWYRSGWAIAGGAGLIAVLSFGAGSLAGGVAGFVIGSNSHGHYSMRSPDRLPLDQRLRERHWEQPGQWPEQPRSFDQGTSGQGGQRDLPLPNGEWPFRGTSPLEGPPNPTPTPAP